MSSPSGKEDDQTLRELLVKSPQPPISYQPGPYRNAAVRFRACSLQDFEERKRLLEGCGLKPFMFPTSKIADCDLGIAR